MSHPLILTSTCPCRCQFDSKFLDRFIDVSKDFGPSKISLKHIYSSNLGKSKIQIVKYAQSVLDQPLRDKDSYRDYLFVIPAHEMASLFTSSSCVLDNILMVVSPPINCGVSDILSSIDSHNCLLKRHVTDTCETASNLQSNR